MRHIIPLVIFVAVVAGLAGSLTVAQLSGNAGAAPPPPQAREDQIIMFAHGRDDTSPWISGDPSWVPLMGGAAIPFAAVDPGDYPLSATFRFDALWDAKPNETSCARLFDITAGSGVTGTEICHTSPMTTTVTMRERSAATTLASGQHEYGVQVQCNPYPCTGHNFYSARIIAEWTERTR